MRPHVKLYFDHFGYDESDFIPCECGCQRRSVEIHHIDSRGMGGRKSADTIDNLVALTRECHERAHGPESRIWKERFKEIVFNRQIATDAYKEECFKGIEKGLLDKPIKFTSKK